MSDPQPIRRRTLAGWPLPRVIVALVLTLAACWVIWATRTLVELRARRIISVSLTAMIREFVASEARTPRTREDSAARTSAYLIAIDRAVTELGRDGTIVLISEATLGRSVPDRTAEVRRRITVAMERGDDRR